MEEEPESCIQLVIPVLRVIDACLWGWQVIAWTSTLLLPKVYLRIFCLPCNRFNFPDGVVELFAERVASKGLCAQAQAESLK